MRNRTMSKLSLEAALISALHPSLSVRVKSAPNSIRYCTTTVSPLKFLALMLAPHLTRYSTTSKWPFPAASITMGFPLVFLVLMFAPHSKRYRPTSTWRLLSGLFKITSLGPRSFLVCGRSQRYRTTSR
ncbi:hypothetical protein PHMEG_00033120 [Phytophthora megakarya]|uniref:Uncharacterized protein n=1 Tax=Phytophthora megakarya TaxID=4795 RepID=A0A225UUH6_9STRA|nr:hypothetical protein PHMEG_00033120 [Phytophthora megakarya]